MRVTQQCSSAIKSGQRHDAIATLSGRLPLICRCVWPKAKSVRRTAHKTYHIVCSFRREWMNQMLRSIIRVWSAPVDVIIRRDILKGWRLGKLVVLEWDNFSCTSTRATWNSFSRIISSVWPFACRDVTIPACVSVHSRIQSLLLQNRQHCKYSKC